MVFNLGEFCYYFSPKNEKKTWDEARLACRNLYRTPSDRSKKSDLASIHDRNEQAFLAAHSGEDGISRWIGLHEDSGDSEMYWSDDTEVDYVNWKEVEPRTTTEVNISSLHFAIS